MIQLIKNAMQNFTAKRNGLVRQREIIRRAIEQGEKALADNERDIIACDGAIAALTGVHEAAARAETPPPPVKADDVPAPPPLSPPFPLQPVKTN